MMEPHKIVSHDEWVAARKAHLAEEKTFTRARDALSRKRRELPWEKVDKNYVFDGPNGKETLADLFGGKSQLIIYHFMLGPDWEEGCKSCSLLADHFDGSVVHLAERDVAFVVVSRAPLAANREFSSSAWAGISNGCPRSAMTSISTTTSRYCGREGEGRCSVQLRNHRISQRRTPRHQRVLQERGRRSLPHVLFLWTRPRMLIGAYNFLDLAPKGRDEEGLH